MNLKFPILLAVTIILSSLSYARNEIWDNDVSLWVDAANKSSAWVRPNYHAGLAYSDIGNDKLAFFYLRRANDADNSFFYANLFRRVEEYLQSGRHEEAIIEYKRLLLQTPGDAVILNRLGNIYYEINLLSDAEKSYREAILANPAFSEAHSNLGMVYNANKRFNKAVLEFQAAIKFAPRDPTPYAELGRNYAEMGLIEKAVPEVSTALMLDPQHTKARRYFEQIMRYKESRKN